MNANPSVPVSSRGTAEDSPASTREDTASIWRTCPNVKPRRNVPNADGARTPVKTRFIPPWRNTARSSMLSAPASIPATTPGGLHPRVRAGHAQPLLEQIMQAGSFRQPHHRQQTSRTNQVRVIKDRRNLKRCLHLSNAASDDTDQTLRKSNPPAPHGHSRATTRNIHPPIGGSGLNGSASRASQPVDTRFLAFPFCPAESFRTGQHQRGEATSAPRHGLGSAPTMARLCGLIPKYFA